MCVSVSQASWDIGVWVSLCVHVPLAACASVIVPASGRLCVCKAVEFVPQF